MVGLINQALYHEILLLQKFIDIGRKALKPLKKSVCNLRKNETGKGNFFLNLNSLCKNDIEVLLWCKLKRGYPIKSRLGYTVYYAESKYEFKIREMKF